MGKAVIQKIYFHILLYIQSIVHKKARLIDILVEYTF